MTTKKTLDKRSILRTAKTIAVAGGLAVTTALSLYAQAAEPARPVVKVLAVKPEKVQVGVGELVRVSFELETPPRWHTYPAARKPLLGRQTLFEFQGAEIAGAIVEPRPRYHRDGVLESDFHEGKVTITVPIRLAAGARPGPVELQGRIVYQLCDWNLCLNGEVPFQFPLRVVDGVPAPTPTSR